MGILEHDAHGSPQVRLFDLVDVDAVIADLAVGNVVEAIDEVGDGGLAGAGGAYEGDLLAGLCPEADVVEHQLILVIAEVHTIQGDAALQLGVGSGAVVLGLLPGPDIGALGRLLHLAVGLLPGVHQFHIALVCLRLLVH